MVKDFESDFKEFLLGVYKGMGMDNLSSQLFAELFLEPDEVSIDDLSKITGYSLASVSNKMRLFEGMCAVERRKKPGSKKVYYYLEKNMIKMWIKKIELLNERLIEPSKNKLPGLIKNNQKLNKEKSQKMEIIKNYFSQMQQIEIASKQMKKYLIENENK